MNSIFNNLLQNYVSHHHPSANSNTGNDNSLIGSKPMDWLTNAAVFAGADTLLNRYDEDHEKNNIHFWRNAGLAGALALGYQYWKTHHDQQQQQQLQSEQAQQLVTAPQQQIQAPPPPPPPQQQPQPLAYYYPPPPQGTVMPYMPPQLPPSVSQQPQHFLLSGYAPSPSYMLPYQPSAYYPSYSNGEMGLPFQNNMMTMLQLQQQDAYNLMMNNVSPFTVRPAPWVPSSAPVFPLYQQQQQMFPPPFVNGHAMIPHYSHSYGMF